MSRERIAKLLSLFFLALALFNYPLIGLFSKGMKVGGIPLLYGYLFFAWGLVILVTARIIESGKPR